MNARIPERPVARRQDGFTLIEALFAVLVFSLGVLALIGFQASAIKASSDARARSDATLIANKVIGDLWTNLGTPCSPNALAAIQSGTTLPAQWSAMASQLLPGNASATPPTPSVSVDISNAPNVVVIVSWQQPGDSTQHNVSVSAQIATNVPATTCS